MQFNDFLRERRRILGMTQADVADQLTLRGQETSYARVSHWERGRNKPPLEDKAFREALATTLNLEVNEMMAALDYMVLEDARSPDARLAAEIVDHLPEAGKKLAIEYLRTLERYFSQAQRR